VAEARRREAAATDVRTNLCTVSSGIRVLLT